jgi:hypothetical protein
MVALQNFITAISAHNQPDDSINCYNRDLHRIEGKDFCPDIYESAINIRPRTYNMARTTEDKQTLREIARQAVSHFC